MKQVQPETLPKNSNFSSCLQNILYQEKSPGAIHFQVPVFKVGSQLKFLQGANFFEPKLWMIACTITSFMVQLLYFVQNVGNE
jgi:hypothetical protein